MENERILSWTRAIERLTGALGDPQWRPSRSHIEGARNELLGAAAEIERLTAEAKVIGEREVAAWAERDQYMTSNVKLVAEIKAQRAEIARLRAEIEARKTAAEKVYLEQCAEIARLRAELAVLSDNWTHAWAGDTRAQTIKNVEARARAVLDGKDKGD